MQMYAVARARSHFLVPGRGEIEKRLRDEISIHLAVPQPLIPGPVLSVVLGSGSSLHVYS